MSSITFFRSTALLIAVLMYGPALRAQQIFYSGEEAFDMRTDDFAVVGKVENLLYTYHRRGTEHRLLAYNDTLEKTATVLLDFIPAKATGLKFVSAGPNILALYTVADGRELIHCAAHLDAEGRLTGNVQNLDTARPSFFGGRGFSIAISDDRRRIFSYRTESREGAVHLRGSLLDVGGTLIHRLDATFRGDEAFSTGEAVVMRDGGVAVPLYNPMGGKGYSDRIVILSISPEDTAFRVSEPRLNGLFAAPLFLKPDPMNGRLYLAGFYSEKRAGNFDGVLFAYVSLADGAVHNRRTVALDERMRAATGDKSQRRAFNDFAVQQLIVKNDGGFVLVSEEQYLSIRNGYSPGWGYYSFYYSPFAAPSVREYHYNDVLALSYDGEGNREWHAFVRKQQYSQEDGGIFSSYALLNSGGSLHLLFNDFNRNRSVIQLATLGPAGTLDIHALADPATTRADLDWLPRSARQISAREVVVPCLRRRGLSFAKVVF